MSDSGGPFSLCAFLFAPYFEAGATLAMELSMHVSQWLDSGVRLLKPCECLIMP